MEIKYTYQGLLIYLTIAAYLSAFLARTSGKNKAARILYLAGFIVAAASFGYRWYNVHHIPFQNLFEVFLAMGMVVYPLSLFCRRFLLVACPPSVWRSGEAADMLIGAIVLVPAGFVFHAEPQRLPPALQCWLFAPHVAVYLLAYVIMAKAAVQALCHLKMHSFGDWRLEIGNWAAQPNHQLPITNYQSPVTNHQLPNEEATYKIICLGFPLLTLGLIMGSWWGKLAWGDYWGWDPKELWGLASWLIYVEYFHVRYLFGKKYPRLGSCLAILGAVVIVITLLWVNLSRLFTGLHSYAI